jgi:hypothetical protein
MLSLAVAFENSTKSKNRRCPKSHEVQTMECSRVVWQQFQPTGRATPNHVVIL